MAPRRDGVRDRQRRLALDLRRVVPARLSDGGPGRGRALLVAARLDADPGRHGLVVLVARRLRGGGADRVRPRRSPRRSSPRTQAPRSTTPSTCGGAGSSDHGARTGRRGGHAVVRITTAARRRPARTRRSTWCSGRSARAGRGPPRADSSIDPRGRRPASRSVGGLPDRAAEQVSPQPATCPRDVERLEPPCWRSQTSGRWSVSSQRPSGETSTGRLAEVTTECSRAGCSAHVSSISRHDVKQVSSPVGVVVRS